MACSEARLAANRANARKSTGPRSANGKAHSRGNALKHGLSGAGVVLPSEVEAEVRAKEAAFERELKPGSEVERELVRRIALGAVRSQRCFHLEMTLTEANRQRDLERFDSDRAEAAEVLGARLAEDPAATVLRLRRTAVGCDWLVDRWENLARGLDGGVCIWNEDDLARALDLLGVHPDERHLDAWALDYRALWERATGADPEVADDARQALADRIAEEIAALKDLAERRFERDKVDYVLLETNTRFDTSSEVLQVRRLGAAADQMFQSGLARLLARPLPPEPATLSASARPSTPPIVASRPEPVTKTKPTALPLPTPWPNLRDRDPARNDDVVLPARVKPLDPDARARA